MSSYRCSKCRARHKLLKPPQEYIRPKRCLRCRALMHPYPARRTDAHFTLDSYRQRKERGKGAKTCGCSGYSFPHRRGSGYCWHNPRLTEDDEGRRTTWA